MEHLAQRANEDLLAGALVCRHSDGGTAVPANQSGEQTYVERRKGAGGMKGISTSVHQVDVWVSSFRVCAHFDIDIVQSADDEEKPHSGAFYTFFKYLSRLDFIGSTIGISCHEPISFLVTVTKSTCCDCVRPPRNSAIYS